MKLSLNQLKREQELNKWSDDVLNIGTEKLVEKIGAQLGAVEEINYFTKKYNDILIVKVVECIKHPNADKLSVCKVDDNNQAKNVERDNVGLITVVCGAPNVHAGMMAAWLPPGAVVPNTANNDPFILEAREIRGIKSNGMLASPKELSLYDNHEGILEIDAEQKAGTSFGEAFGLNDDVLIDIENKMFTHRPDCFGLIGLAREIAGINNQSFKSPSWYQFKPDLIKAQDSTLSLEINNELPSLVPRFMAATMSNIAIGPSPTWLQISLSRLGIRPISNIVDLTNYYMILTGQPMHAYDYDKVKSLTKKVNATIVIRNPKPGEKLTLLSGKTITPNSSDIMIATDEKLIGLAGIMGGSETEVDQNTKNIIIECANFDMYSIRKSSMEHGIFTDASTRFTKGQSPLQNEAVINKMVDDAIKLTGGQLSSEFIDNNHIDEVVKKRASLYPPITISLDFILKRLGVNLTLETVAELLNNVEFKVETKNDELTVKAPFWRTDIELREDIVEEVGRLYGYDKLPLTLPSRDLTPVSKDGLIEAKDKIRESLSRSGANEILTYSFIAGTLIDKVGQNKDLAFKVANALRPELQYYRMSLMPSLLDKVHPNIKAGYDSFSLFEIGKTHSIDQIDKDELPKEFEFLALVIAKNDKLKINSSAYYLAKDYLLNLCNEALQFKPISEDMKSYPVVSPYDDNRSALIYIKETGEFMGIIGEFKASVRRNLKLPKYCAGFEVDNEVLAKLIAKPTSYTSLPRFPQVTQDISLKVKSSASYQEVYDLVQQALDDNKPERALAFLDPQDIYQDIKDATHKNVTLRLSLASYERTLTDQEVNSLLNKVAEVLKDKIGAERL